MGSAAVSQLCCHSIIPQSYGNWIYGKQRTPIRILLCLSLRCPTDMCHCLCVRGYAKPDFSIRIIFLSHRVNDFTVHWKVKSACIILLWLLWFIRAAVLFGYSFVSLFIVLSSLQYHLPMNQHLIDIALFDCCHYFLTKGRKCLGQDQDAGVHL